MGGAEKKTVYTWVSTNPAASYNWIIGTVESVYEGVTYITSIVTCHKYWRGPAADTNRIQ